MFAFIRRITAHLGRWALFAAILLLIRHQYARRNPPATGVEVDLPTIQSLFPDARRLDSQVSSRGTQNVLDAQERPLGYLVQTSPQSDSILGYSGPTNVLLAFDLEHRLQGLRILSSRDTADHVQAVLDDSHFLKLWDDLTWEQAGRFQQIDGVSGATLTSLAIAESIAYRLSGGRPAYRFPQALKLEQAKKFFPQAASLQAASLQESDEPRGMRVLDAEQNLLGRLFRTSPAADKIVGYQGQTDTIIALDKAGKIVGIAIHQTYDNQEYADYVREEEYFLTLFNGKTLPELAELDVFEEQVEGVSGATMTSMAMVDGMVLAAQAQSEPVVVGDKPERRLAWRDWGTIAVVLLALLIAATSLRGKAWVRRGFQAVLIGYLGFYNGDLLSLALGVGWAQSGVPWRSAVGLCVLALAALAVPLFTRRQLYCQHLCPHGAAQQFLMNAAVRWRLRIPRRLSQAMRLLPGVLLAWGILVAARGWSYNLADVEPFDAYLWRVAGWPSILIAASGLLASLWIPMAYCRYGCPTGAILNFLRWNSQSGQMSARDVVALFLLLLAVGLTW